MNIVFRVDSYREIGTGHLMRCLNLADELNEIGNIWFMTIASDHSLDLINRRGYKTLVIESIKNDCKYKRMSAHQDAKKSIDLLTYCGIKADLLIVDNYLLDYRWEEMLRTSVTKIFVIDDLANRKHSCDMLLDQNFVENMDSRYEGLVSDKTRVLLGPKYAILGKEYSLQREKISFRSNDIKRVLISFGGVDEFNVTAKLIGHLKSCKFKDIQFDTVITDNFVHLDNLLSICDEENIIVHRNLESLASLMRECDLAIGAGGTTTWERLAMALPSVVITIADNQLETASMLHEQGLIHWLGHFNSLDVNWKENLDYFIQSKDTNEDNSKKIFSLVDGCGAENVKRNLMSLV